MKPAIKHIVYLLIGFGVFTTNALPSSAEVNPCHGVTDPAALTKKILDIRAQKGWTAPLPGGCYDSVLTLYTKASGQAGQTEIEYFEQLVILAGAFLPDDGESEVTRTLVDIIMKDRHRLQQAFSKILPRVNGFCTRLELEATMKDLLCEADHDPKGDIWNPDRNENPKCLKVSNAFWKSYDQEACRKEHGS